MDDELRRSGLVGEFPRWHFWRGVNGLLYAQRLKRSPPVTLRGADPAVLRGEVRAWLDQNQCEA